MRIRHLIAALMVLLSLTAQARTVFACAMMPGMAQAHCCCADGGRCAPMAKGGACCDEVAPADAPLAGAAAYVFHGIHADSFDLAGGPAPYLLPAATDSGGRTPAPGTATPSPPLPVYLLTARLRL